MICTTHPERRAASVCQKFAIGQCSECAACKEPNSYCKFRDECVAWALQKEKNFITSRQKSKGE